jgi:serine/threonine protein kinase
LRIPCCADPARRCPSPPHPVPAQVFLTPTHLCVVMEYVEGENLQQFLANTGGRCAPAAAPALESPLTRCRCTDPVPRLPPPPPPPSCPPSTLDTSPHAGPRARPCRASEALARFLFQQLVLALDFCHRKGKVSRDVKLANTLLALAQQSLPLVKLCDFGYSKDTMMHSAPASQVGGMMHSPPVGGCDAAEGARNAGGVADCRRAPGAQAAVVEGFFSDPRRAATPPPAPPRSAPRCLSRPR